MVSVIGDVGKVKLLPERALLLRETVAHAGVGDA